ncbi:AraC family transcriptional regulator [Lapillicoccus sp.]|uniref:AraC family transcriptional regulator n=1 Tax=Lapillicoccus sp. TaxID=1909287 RepID=UPI0025DFC2AB|nr:AraC family transcriptional regulator [Lapillicoccus sp.]
MDVLTGLLDGTRAREAFVLRCRLSPPFAMRIEDEAPTRPTVVIHPGQRCTSPDGSDLGDLASLGMRTWGSPGPSPVVFVTGVYERRAEVGHRLLPTLPHLLVLAPGAWNAPLVDYLQAEIDRDVLGQAAVLDRVVDLLVVAALREWLDRPGSGAPGWYHAQADPLVGPVLALIHDQPGHPWSLAGLAAAVGWSRSTLARRFAQLVGESR